MNYFYRFRLYPTKEKVKWNYYEYKKLLPKLKREFEFLKLSNSQSLQESLKNLDKVFKNFFKGFADFPKFKKKKKTNSISILQHFEIVENKIKIPKLKTPIKFKKHRVIEDKIKSISIAITPSGKYYLNVLVDKAIQPLSEINKIIAIDMGLTDFIVTSDNQAVKNPKYFKKLERRLKLCQRKLSRKKAKAIR